MIDFKSAKNLVDSELETYSKEINKKVSIIDNLTEENSEYWVFYYNTDVFIKTGNLSFALAGNGPILVDKYQGTLYKTGTSKPLEHYLKYYEEYQLPLLRRKPK